LKDVGGALLRERFTIESLPRMAAFTCVLSMRIGAREIGEPAFAIHF